jgi:hypothetical protein
MIVYLSRAEGAPHYERSKAAASRLQHRSRVYRAQYDVRAEAVGLYQKITQQLMLVIWLEFESV